MACVRHAAGSDRSPFYQRPVRGHRRTTMISASDVPACPACGSRAVHCVYNPPGPKLYACIKCGRDNTAAWEAVQPERRPEPKPLIGNHSLPAEPDALPLGICAELKT